MRHSNSVNSRQSLGRYVSTRFPLQHPEGMRTVYNVVNQSS